MFSKAKTSQSKVFDLLSRGDADGAIAEARMKRERAIKKAKAMRDSQPNDATEEQLAIHDWFVALSEGDYSSGGGGLWIYYNSKTDTWSTDDSRNTCEACSKKFHLKYIEYFTSDEDEVLENIDPTGKRFCSTKCQRYFLARERHKRENRRKSRQRTKQRNLDKIFGASMKIAQEISDE